MSTDNKIGQWANDIEGEYIYLFHMWIKWFLNQKYQGISI